MTGDRGERASGHGSARPGAPSGPAALEQDFDAGSLYALRSAVGAHAAAAGLGADRVYDAIVTAHELAANSVRHGAGRGRLRLWAADGVLVCQVSDSGQPEPGKVTAAGWPAEHSHGLWVVAQVADHFSIDSGPAGTTATATFALQRNSRDGEPA
jgi:anti-sigma regulatory factor (Ser/Thr protein kinase)